MTAEPTTLTEHLPQLQVSLFIAMSLYILSVVIVRISHPHCWWYLGLFFCCGILDISAGFESERRAAWGCWLPD